MRVHQRSEELVSPPHSMPTSIEDRKVSSRPHVMMSTRPQSAPSNLPRKEKRDFSCALLLPDKSRRSMDCIDAIGSLRIEYSTDDTHSCDERRAFEPSPSKSSGAVSENPAESESTPTVPPLDISSYPNRKMQAQIMTSVSTNEQMQRIATPSNLDAQERQSQRLRAPVSRTLVIDPATGAPDHNTANQSNTNPPEQVFGCKAEEPGKNDMETSSVDSVAFRRRSNEDKKARHPKMILPECILSESVVVDDSFGNAHVTVGPVGEQAQSQRRPMSRSQSADTGRPGSTISHLHTGVRQQTKQSTASGLAFRDRRHTELQSWQFRSSSPGPAGFAYARPVLTPGNVARGQLLESGVTYLGSAHTTIRDPRYSHQADLKLWPNCMRKSVWNKMSNDSGPRPPDTSYRVRMLCEDTKLAEQLFQNYAIPMHLGGENIMLQIPFLDCLTHLEAIDGTSPVLHLALEISGVSDHKHRAKRALLSREGAMAIFEHEALTFSVRSEREEDAEGSNSCFSGLTKDKFFSCLSRVADLLDDRRHDLQQAMPKRAGVAKNRRLPMDDLRELRGQSRKDAKILSPFSPLRAQPSEATLHSPLASISAMSRGVTEPTVKQAALFKALKSQTVLSEYKQLARQVAREAMMQLGAAVSSNTRTRKELEWLLVLRDQALTSLGLIVSADQIRAAADSTKDDKGLEEGEDINRALRWAPPAWAWVVPSDHKKPISPVIDGWYLVSADPGPVLRLKGPLGNRSKAIKAIEEFKSLDMKLFNVCLMRDSSVVETFVYDVAGLRVQEAITGDAKSDGWYVMIDESEKRIWALSIEVTRVQRQLMVLKKEASTARKTLRDLEVSNDIHKTQLLLLSDTPSILTF